MKTFEPGDVVKMPFPYQEATAGKYRPALVVSSPELQEVHGVLWVLMITSAKSRPWAGDVEIPHLEGTGLPAPSVVRCAKIAITDASTATRIGRLGQAQIKLVSAMMQRALGMAPG
jgi:mRNA interferase MazF